MPTNNLPLGDRSSLETHFTILAALHIAASVLLLLGAAIVFLAVTGTGMFVDDPAAARILVPLGTLLALFLAVLSVPGLAGGIGLLRRQPWSRIVLLILGAINLVNIPFGTALGIYTFWVLLQDEAKDLLAPV